jgi:hypothetical protein
MILLLTSMITTRKDLPAYQIAFMQPALLFAYVQLGTRTFLPFLPRCRCKGCKGATGSPTLMPTTCANRRTRLFAKDLHNLIVDISAIGWTKLVTPYGPSGTTTSARSDHGKGTGRAGTRMACSATGVTTACMEFVTR